LLMVFALVGDSTMTSDFGNVTLFPLFQVEATMELLVGTNCGRATGTWYLVLSRALRALSSGFDFRRCSAKLIAFCEP
jgi:hypothetical protein